MVIKAKTILVVVADSMPGGITTAARNLCEGLVRRGHEVTLLNMSADDSGFFGLDERISRVALCGLARCWQLGIKDVKRERSLVKKVLLMALGIVKKATNKNGLWNGLVFSAFRLSNSYDAAFAFRQCEPCYQFVLDKVKAKVKVGFIHGELACMGDVSSWSRMFPKFDSVACVSDYVRQEFSQSFPSCSEKFRCAYNFINAPTIIEKSKIGNVDYFSQTAINLITISRVENGHKQIDLVPHACRLLRDMGIRNFHWYVVGDGPDLELDARLADDLGVMDLVSFIGYRKNPYPLLKKADLCVVTSRYEAFGMVVKEAQVLGVPVLSTHYSAVYEVIMPEENGLVVENNAEGVAQGISDLLEGDALKLRLLQAKTKECSVADKIAYEQIMRIVVARKV